jgi:hypothetical protein
MGANNNIEENDLENTKEKDMSPLTDKEKADSLLQLAKIHRDQFDERRRTEWKLVFVVLAFYFSLITARITEKVDLTNIPQWEIALIIFGIAFVACIYLAFIHNANHKNKSFAKNAENKVERLLGYTKNEIFAKDNTKKGFIKKLKNWSERHPWLNWSSASQWFLILLIAIGTFIVLTST